MRIILLVINKMVNMLTFSGRRLAFSHASTSGNFRFVEFSRSSTFLTFNRSLLSYAKCAKLRLIDNDNNIDKIDCDRIHGGRITQIIKSYFGAS